MSRDIVALVESYINSGTPIPTHIASDFIHAYNNKLQIIQSFEELGYIPSEDPQPARLSGSAH